MPVCGLRSFFSTCVHCTSGVCYRSHPGRKGRQEARSSGEALFGSSNRYITVLYTWHTSDVRWPLLTRGLFGGRAWIRASYRKCNGPALPVSAIVRKHRSQFPVRSQRARSPSFRTRRCYRGHPKVFARAYCGPLTNAREGCSVLKRPEKRDTHKLCKTLIRQFDPGPPPGSFFRHRPTPTHRCGVIPTEPIPPKPYPPRRA